MKDEDLQKQLTSIMAEATYASMTQAALWTALINNGAIAKSAAIAALDEELLVMDHRRGKAGKPAQFWDYCRSRLTALMMQIEAIPEPGFLGP